MKTMRDKNGKVKRVVEKDKNGKIKRVFSYRCDLGPKKNKLRQMTLPFLRTTPKGKEGGQEDTERKNFSTFTPTEGQNMTADERAEGAGINV